ncbi:integrase [Leptospira brenneri]|uniref:integrase n=1 Tax=Leptospira brenneri TaxID=2023182 RepID=UPI000C2A835A|nr:integrase [Leptospira brenneri]PJZ43697.1 integrase [Leptospira brenneri]
MKQLDVGIVMPLFRDWKLARERGTRSEIGQIVKRAVDSLGLARPQVYNIFNRLLEGESIFSVAKVERKKTGSRLGVAEIALREIEIYEITKLMFAGEVQHEQAKTGTGKDRDLRTVGFALNRKYGKSMEFAIEQAERLGTIRKGVWDRFKLGRALNERGITRKQMGKPLASVTWMATYANQFWMFDASPLNAVYLEPGKDSRISIRPDIESGLTRIYEGSKEATLRKVHIYVAVDVYSKAFYAYAYAPIAKGKESTHGGENSTDWHDFLCRAFLEKDDGFIPIQGTPERIYTDKHTAFESLSGFFSRLDIIQESHFPGHSKAKGPIESRISAIKRCCETMAVKGMIRDLDEFNLLLYRYQISRNDKLKSYKKWLKSANEKPINAVSKQNLTDASIKEEVRKINAYGCIEIEATQYLLRYPNGHVVSDRTKETVKVYRNPRSGFEVLTSDGIRLSADPAGPIGREPGSFKNVGDRSGLTETKRIRNRKKVLSSAKAVEKTLILSDALPNLPEIPYGKLHVSKEHRQTHTPMAPEKFESTDDAFEWMLNELGHSEDTLEELSMKLADERDENLSIGAIVLQLLRSAKRKLGYIPAQEVYDTIEIIRGTFPEVSK